VLNGGTQIIGSEKFEEAWEEVTQVVFVAPCGESFGGVSCKVLGGKLAERRGVKVVIILRGDAVRAAADVGAKFVAVKGFVELFDSGIKNALTRSEKVGGRVEQFDVHERIIKGIIQS